MTRARKDGEGAEAFGHRERAFVVKPSRKWFGHKPHEFAGRPFPSWREAMDYALGSDE